MYDFQGGTPPYSAIIVNHASLNATELTDASSGIYEWVVVDANGCAFRDTVVLENITSTNEIKGNATVNISPNPTRKYIVINIDFSLVGYLFGIP